MFNSDAPATSLHRMLHGNRFVGCKAAAFVRLRLKYSHGEQKVIMLLTSDRWGIFFKHMLTSFKYVLPNTTNSVDYRVV